MSRRTIVIILIIVVMILGGALWRISGSSNKEETQRPTQTVELPKQQNDKYNHVDIKLNQGKLDSAPTIYVVSPGTNMEFSVSSDKTGAIGVPSEPPQKITFTKSPVVFRLTASNPGSYQLTFLSDGGSDKDIIAIGAIQVNE